MEHNGLMEIVKEKYPEDIQQLEVLYNKLKRLQLDIKKFREEYKDVSFENEEYEKIYFKYLKDNYEINKEILKIESSHPEIREVIFTEYEPERLKVVFPPMRKK